MGTLMKDWPTDYDICGSGFNPVYRVSLVTES